MKHVGGDHWREEVIHDSAGHGPCESRGEVSSLERANVRDQVEKKSEVHPGIDKPRRTGRVPEQPALVETKDGPWQGRDQQESRIDARPLSPRLRAELWEVRCYRAISAHVDDFADLAAPGRRCMADRVRNIRRLNRLRSSQCLSRAASR